MFPSIMGSEEIEFDDIPYAAIAGDDPEAYDVPDYDDPSYDYPEPDSDYWE